MALHWYVPSTTMIYATARGSANTRLLFHSELANLTDDKPCILRSPSAGIVDKIEFAIVRTPHGYGMNLSENGTVLD